MARRTVRSLTPRVVAASRADTGHLSGAPDTPRRVVLSRDRSSMMAAASAMSNQSARTISTPHRRGHPLCPRGRSGIAPEHQSRLFDRFYRAESGTRTADLGMGLYISRMLVEAHG